MRTGLFKLSERLGNLTPDDLIELELKYFALEDWWRIDQTKGKHRLQELSGRRIVTIWLPIQTDEIPSNGIVTFYNVEIIDEDAPLGSRMIQLHFVREGLDNYTGT